MMLQGSRVVVTTGERQWLPEAARQLRTNYTDAGAFVAVFQAPAGRLGFDIDEASEAIFGWIIGEAYSWCPKESRAVRYKAGSPTDYVRGLFVRGLQLPITLAATVDRSPEQQPLPPDDSMAAVSAKIRELSAMDLDHESTAFAREIASLARVCDRVCVHAVAQWETIVITTQAGRFLEGLEGVCKQTAVSFSHVASERELPQW